MGGKVIPVLNGEGGAMQNTSAILVGKPEGNRQFARIDVDGKVTLKWMWTRFNWFRTGICGRVC